MHATGLLLMINGYFLDQTRTIGIDPLFSHAGNLAGRILAHDRWRLDYIIARDANIA